MPTLFGLQTNRSIIQGSENYSTGICSSESEVLCCSRIAFSSSRSTESAKKINEISCITGLAMSGRIAVKANVLALGNPACQWPQQNLSCCSLRHAAPCFLTQRWDQIDHTSQKNHSSMVKMCGEMRTKSSRLQRIVEYNTVI